MKWKQLLLIVLVSAVSAVSSVVVYNKLTNKNTAFIQSTDGKVPANYAGFLDNAVPGVGEPIDFTKAANATVPAVVHIKTKIPAKKVSNSLQKTFCSPETGRQMLW